MRWMIAAPILILVAVYAVDRHWLAEAMADNTPTIAPPPPTAGASVAGLKDTLEKGLRARLPQDFVFINKVVTMVKNDQLPSSVVLGTFHWVRKNRGHKKYLVAYFAQVLRSRAAQLGIQIT